MRAMPPDRWDKLVELFHRAREASAEGRAALLQQTGLSDPDLRSDLEEMLRDGSSSDGFLSQGFAADLAAKARLDAGHRIGHYRIVARLGSGGMGVVYKAEDTKLRRSVAIKLVLSHPLAGGNETERLLREAQAAAALNHANICPIYEINESEGFPYVVMAALEGETLAQHLSGGRRMEIRDAISVASQVAAGLSAAHQKGIVHRDIKTANIFVNPQTRGRLHATLLDFGLALAANSPRLTREGSVAGTVSYMSPEQTRGEALDHRTDLWSLGVVLYEMLTGVRPFNGGPEAVILDAIANRHPKPASELRVEIPPSVDALIGKALAKDPADRHTDAGEVAAELEDIAASLSQRDGAPSPQEAEISHGRGRWQRAAVLTVAMASAIGLAGFAAWQWGQKPAPTMPAFQMITQTVAENRVLAAALSPKGDRLAYIDLEGVVHLQQVGTSTTRPVARLPGLQAVRVVWFEDEQKLLVNGFAARQPVSEMWAVPLNGAPAYLLHGNASGATPSPDGTQIAYLNSASSEIWTMMAGSRSARRLVAGLRREEFLFVFWSEDGTRIHYAQRASLAPTATDAERQSLYRENLEWNLQTADAKSGSLLFSQPKVKMLFPNPVSGNRLIYMTWHRQENSLDVWLEEAELLRSGMLGRKTKVALAETLVSLSASRDGSRLATIRLDLQPEIFVGDWSSRTRRFTGVERLTFDRGEEYPHAWSADSRSVIFESNRHPPYALFRQELGSREAIPLVDHPDSDVMAQLSPDGKWILFLSGRAYANRQRIWKLKRVPAQGGHAEVVPNTGWVDEFRCALRGERCVLRQVSNQQYVFSEVDAVTGKGRELTRTAWTRGNFGDWALSPDGSQVAFPEIDALNPTIRIIDLDHPGVRDSNLVLSGSMPIRGVTWSADGEGLLVAMERSIELPLAISNGLVDLRWVSFRGESHVIATSTGATWAVPSPDGRRIAYLNQLGMSNVWALQR